MRKWSARTENTGDYAKCYIYCEYGNSRSMRMFRYKYYPNAPEWILDQAVYVCNQELSRPMETVEVVDA